MAGGIALIAKNASFDQATEIYAPVMDGLTGWYYPRGDADRAAINHAPGGANGFLVGAPTISAGYMSTISGSKYLQTFQAETEDFTWLIVARTAASLVGAANQPALIGNYPNSGTASALLYITNDTSPVPVGRARGQAWLSGAAAVRQSVIPDVTKWHLYAVVMDSAGNLAVHSLTDAIVVSSAVAGTRELNGNPLRIGSTYYASFTGVADIAFAAFYDRALDTTELGDLHDFIAFDLSYEGITV